MSGKLKDLDLEGLRVDPLQGGTWCAGPWEEWTELVKKYKKSKKKQDKELYEILNGNFLPDILKMFEDQEGRETEAVDGK